MKRIKVEPMVMYSVISEPNDGTRYSYYVIKRYDDYEFVPDGSVFNYPQVINKWTALKEEDLSVDFLRKNGMTKNITLIAEQYNSNPWTVAECMRTIQEIENDNK